MGHALLQPLQAEPHKDQAPPPVGVDGAAFAGQAHRITLQTAGQPSDHHHQQPINALRFAQTAALQLEEAGFLITQQLLAAESLAVAPDQSKLGSALLTKYQGSAHTHRHDHLMVATDT